jgi:hypothetical protein
MAIAPLDANSPIIEDDMTMIQRFRTWANAMTRVAPLDGVGSPEGVIEALPTQTYMDTTGAAGSIYYIKRDADIGGDRRLGWILV